MSQDDYARASSVKPIPSHGRPLAGRALSRDELRRLFRSCRPDTFAGSRDAAMLVLLAGAGLRRAEVTALDLSDWDAEKSVITVRHGKGDKHREVDIAPWAALYLTTWFCHRGREPGALVCSLKGRHRLTPQGIAHVLRTRGAAVEVTGFSLHDFRRTYISDLLAAGAELHKVAELVGHSHIDTTARYDRRGAVARKHAAMLLRSPLED